jgi:hypothetical protein
MMNNEEYNSGIISWLFDIRYSLPAWSSGRFDIHSNDQPEYNYNKNEPGRPR